mgnify:CR=1 FL=1
MCIRDRYLSLQSNDSKVPARAYFQRFDNFLCRKLYCLTPVILQDEVLLHQIHPCLLYTSDAADERSSVDLGGRRIINKKNTYK